MSPRLRLVISMADQNLKVFQGEECIRSFAVSTSAKGMGFELNSYRTPAGRFRVAARIGEGQPSGTIFKSRIPAGLWLPGDAPGQDLILSRILRLDGLDAQNANTLERCIYIHGTNREDLLGQAASMGCVRLGNADMIELFNMVAEGDPVVILPD